MLYSLFILTLGIYLGQEYTIPNVRLIGISLLGYMEKLQKEQENYENKENKNDNDNSQFISSKLFQWN